MEKETFYGSYRGVKFYGVGQLSFLHWCYSNNVKIENNTANKIMYTEDGKKQLKPIFFLPEYDLYLDVRSNSVHNRYRRNYEFQLRKAVSTHNDDFIYMFDEKIGTLSFTEARKLLLETDGVKITDQLRNKLEMLRVQEKVTIPMISMPRWFRNRLAEIRKEKSKEFFAVEA